MLRRIMAFAVIFFLGLLFSSYPEALPPSELPWTEIDFNQMVFDPPPLEAGGPTMPFPETTAGAHWRYYPVYNIQAAYDPVRGEIRGELLLAYQNPYLDSLRRLYFNLPANAPFGNGAQLTVQMVAVNKRPAVFNLQGSSLEVVLPRSLAPRETLTLALSFNTSVPAGGGRLGCSGDTITAAGWYPLLAPRSGDAPAGVTAGVNSYSTSRPLRLNQHAPAGLASSQQAVPDSQGAQIANQPAPAGMASTHYAASDGQKPHMVKQSAPAGLVSSQQAVPDSQGAQIANQPAPAGVASTSYGEPYFAPAAYYQVRLTLPAGYQVLAAARTTGRMEGDGRTTWTFNSDYPVREFAFVAAPDWQFTTHQAGNVQLVAAARGEPAGEALATAAQALAFFQAIYGPYPYSYLHLAFVPLDNLAGMEYPGLILLSNRKVYRPSTVIHEIAHQWWYNLVGNDSCRAAWIDEGLAEYSTLLFYREYDPALYRVRLAEVERLAGRSSLPVNLSLEEYGREESYRQAVYSRGAQFWLRMEAAAGTTQLHKALAYIQQYYRYEIVPADSLLLILTYYGRLQAADFTPFLGN